MRRRTCYVCGGPATTKEHVPPRCFGYEHDDFVGRPQPRPQRLTVPSCATHNNDHSETDEWLRSQLMHASRGAALSTDMAGTLTRMITADKKKAQRMYAGHVDAGDRAIAEFQKIAAALYFSETKTRLGDSGVAAIDIRSPSLVLEKFDPKRSPGKRRLVPEATSADMALAPWNDCGPWKRIESGYRNAFVAEGRVHDQNSRRFAYCMFFYETIEVWATSTG